jgi:soluble lytic murein transglycosylase-like protein
MAQLTLLAALAFLAGSGEGAADPVDRWSVEIEEASGRFGIPEDWIRRVMRAESGGRLRQNGRPIVSRAGAMGLMQIMPPTWDELRVEHRLGNNPHHPRDNILAGTAYLRAMYDRFGYPGLFAAYNAGPARYSRHLAGGSPLPAETMAYIGQVSAATAGPPTRQSSGLFAYRRAEEGREIPVQRDDGKPAHQGLFVKFGTTLSRR